MTFLENLQLHDEKIKEALKVPVLIVGQTVEKKGFDQFMEQRIKPIQENLAYMINVDIVQTAVFNGWIPHWKGLDTLKTLRPTRDFVQDYGTNWMRKMYRKFEKGLIGPLPDAPRFKFKRL